MNSNNKPEKQPEEVKPKKLLREVWVPPKDAPPVTKINKPDSFA